MRRRATVRGRTRRLARATRAHAAEARSDESARDVNGHRDYLTHSALVEGLEWNVRVSQADNPNILERVSATFDQYWNEPEFVDYHPARDGERLNLALASGLGTVAAEAQRGERESVRRVVSEIEATLEVQGFVLRVCQPDPPERTNPSCSACEGSSALSLPILTRLSSRCNGTLGSHQHDVLTS